MTAEKLLPSLIRKMRRLDNGKLEIELDIPLEKLAEIEGSEITDGWVVISAKATGVFTEGEINQTSACLDVLLNSFRHLVVACRAWPIADRKVNKLKKLPDQSRNVTFTMPGKDAALSFTVKAKVKEKAFSLTASEDNLAKQCSREVAQAAAFIVTLTQNAYWSA